MSTRLSFDNEEARRLPLLKLAGDASALFDGLIVSVSRLPVPGLGAVVSWGTNGDAAVIIIDPQQCAELGFTIEDAFAHELAHLIDPRYVVNTVDERESWAKRVGPLLLADAPETVADALALADASAKS